MYENRTCDVYIIDRTRNNIDTIFLTLFYYRNTNILFLFTNKFCCTQQPVVIIIIHINLLGSSKDTPILFIRGCGMAILIVVLIANIELFGKGTIFSLADRTKTCAREEPLKSLKSCTD